MERAILGILTKNEELLREERDNLRKQLAWFNSFVDYIQAVGLKGYNSACEYADNIEREEL